MEVSFFKNSLDHALLEVLWNKYWINTVTSSPLLVNNDYFVHGLQDQANKMHTHSLKQKERKIVLNVTIDELSGKDSNP